MNERPSFLKPVGSASLAEEDDFQLGDILVRPSLREVRAGDTREIVEPRVMQVFVTLARADGAVVSRDELIRQCWGGRIVGEDAINRCISKVRQLAELGGSEAFEIETIPRVGYRLVRSDSAVRAWPIPAATDLAAAADLAAAQPRRSPRLFLLAAAAVLLIAASVAVAVTLLPHRTPQWVIAESHQPFIATPDIDRFPSFSPDGTMIAYSRGKVGARQIFLQLRRGGDPIPSVHDGFDDVGPAFSPDGTSVVYSASRAKQPCRIMLAQIPSGPTRQIGRCRTIERTSFSWDSSGRALFYEDTTNAAAPLQIVRLDVNTGSVSEITHPAATESLSDFQPALSPDGRTLLFMRYRKGGRLQVVLTDLATRSERVLADDDADKYAAWSNDSSAVFVARNTGSDSSLWAYPVAGGAPSRITTNARPMEFLSSGPDGLLAMELKNKVTQLAQATIAPNDIPRPIDTAGYSGCSFDYASDGTMAMIANSGESPIIAVGKPGHLREVLRLKERTPCGIRWSPDGTRIAFGSGDSRFRISVIDREGSPVAQVPYPTEDFGYFEWTPDGKAFLQMRMDSRGWRVWRIDLAAPYTASPVFPHGWDWVRMHNGMAFGVKDGSPGLWRIDGTPKRLTDWPSAEHPWQWTIAGDRLVYADLSDPVRQAIMAQPIAGGPAKAMAYAPDMDGLSLLAVDPATGQVTYNRVVRDDPDIGYLRLVKR